MLLSFHSVYYKDNHKISHNSAHILSISEKGTIKLHTTFEVICFYLISTLSQIIISLAVFKTHQCSDQSIS